MFHISLYPVCLHQIFVIVHSIEDFLAYRTSESILLIYREYLLYIHILYYTMYTHCTYNVLYNKSIGYFLRISFWNLLPVSSLKDLDPTYWRTYAAMTWIQHLVPAENCKLSTETWEFSRRAVSRNVEVSCRWFRPTDLKYRYRIIYRTLYPRETGPLKTYLVLFNGF